MLSGPGCGVNQEIAKRIHAQCWQLGRPPCSLNLAGANARPLSTDRQSCAVQVEGRPNGPGSLGRTRDMGRVLPRAASGSSIRRGWDGRFEERKDTPSCISRRSLVVARTWREYSEDRLQDGERERILVSSSFVVVEKGVPGLGILLDIVLDPHRRQRPLEAIGGPSQCAILAAVASDNRAGLPEEAGRVGILWSGAARRTPLPCSSRSRRSCPYSPPGPPPRPAPPRYRRTTVPVRRARRA